MQWLQVKFERTVEVVGQAMLGREQQAVVFGIDAIVCLLDIAVVLAQRGVGQIGQAPLAGVGGACAGAV